MPESRSNSDPIQIQFRSNLDPIQARPWLDGGPSAWLWSASGSAHAADDRAHMGMLTIPVVFAAESLGFQGRCTGGSTAAALSRGRRVSHNRDHPYKHAFA